MEFNLDEPINAKQILNQIESVVKDASNVKEKHMNTNQEYEKIKVIIEQLKNKTKEVKLHIDNFNDEVDVEQNKNVSIENANKKLDQFKTDFEQLKKGKLSHQVSDEFK